MPRVKRSTKRNDRRKKILKRASGYFLTKSKLYQAAQEAVERGLMFAYTGRKQKKRQYRSLWIVRINAACQAERHELLDLHQRPQARRQRPRSQDPCRHRRQRRRRASPPSRYRPRQPSKPPSPQRSLHNVKHHRISKGTATAVPFSLSVDKFQRKELFTECCTSNLVRILLQQRILYPCRRSKPSKPSRA